MLKKHVFLLLGLLIAGAAWMAAVLPQPLWLFGFGNLLYGSTAFLAITILLNAFRYSCTDLFNKEDQYVNFIKNDLRVCPASQRGICKNGLP